MFGRDVAILPIGDIFVAEPQSQNARVRRASAAHAAEWRPPPPQTPSTPTPCGTLSPFLPWPSKRDQWRGSQSAGGPTSGGQTAILYRRGRTQITCFAHTEGGAGILGHQHTNLGGKRKKKAGKRFAFFLSFSSVAVECGRRVHTTCKQ